MQFRSDTDRAQCGDVDELYRSTPHDAAVAPTNELQCTCLQNNVNVMRGSTYAFVTSMKTSQLVTMMVTVGPFSFSFSDFPNQAQICPVHYSHKGQLWSQPDRVPGVPGSS